MKIINKAIAGGKLSQAPYVQHEDPLRGDMKQRGQVDFGLIVSTAFF